ncbi:hypothetical protein L7F22_021829 [Adiantum nelumboides]|nr:hypothetical protein [Adiantum nelumboides]
MSGSKEGGGNGDGRGAVLILAVKRARAICTLVRLGFTPRSSAKALAVPILHKLFKPDVVFHNSKVVQRPTPVLALVTIIDSPLAS